MNNTEGVERDIVSSKITGVSSSKTVAVSSDTEFILAQEILALPRTHGELPVATEEETKEPKVADKEVSDGDDEEECNKRLQAYEIKFINRLIKRATEHNGYVCGRYVNRVLLPLVQKREPDIGKNGSSVSIRFATHIDFMRFCKGRAFTVVTVETSVWNEPSYTLEFVSSVRVIYIDVTISDTALINDCNINQLIARINKAGDIVLASTSSTLSVEDIQDQIANKLVKFPRVAYEEANKHPEINQIMRNRLTVYKADGWTIDDSEALPFTDFD